VKEKVYITPSPMRGRLRNPQPMKRMYHSLDFSKPIKLPLEQFWNNHSKSQKICKMKNPIVLDLEWVNLHNDHIIWYACFFCCSFRSILFFVAVKKCTKAYRIICSLCRSTHSKSNTARFSILRFFCDLLWFFKTALGVIY
jgi:hypothetical protein